MSACRITLLSGIECYMSDQATSHAQQPLQGLSVLVVDDVDINCMVLQNVLEQVGASAVAVKSGEEAVLEVQRRHYDIVLMDIVMGGISGYEATQRIHQTHPGMPVVALSSSDDKETALASGLIDFLSKPVERDALYQSLQRHAWKSGPAEPVQTDLSTESADTQTALPAVLSAERLAALYSGNDVLIQRCIQSFYNSFSDWGRQYHQACVTENLTEARALAHRLRGAAANIGAESLAQQAAELEEQHRNQQWGACTVLRDQCDSHLKQLETWLQAVEPDEETPTGEIDRNRALQILAELQKDLAGHRLIEDDTITFIRQLRSSAALKAEAEALLLAIDLFDYAPASEHCKRLISEIENDV